MPGSAISSPATRFHDQVRVGWRANLRGVERGEAEPIHDAGGGEGMRAGELGSRLDVDVPDPIREGRNPPSVPLEPRAGHRAPRHTQNKGTAFMTRIKTSFLALATTAAVLAAPAAGFAQEPPLATSGNVHVVDHTPGTASGMNFTGHYG